MTKSVLTEQPGKFPFTRGIHATMYRGKLWTMRQYAGFGDARETNKRFWYLLGHGQTGLSMAFALPTQVGSGSDDPATLGEVSRVGIAFLGPESVYGVPVELCEYQL
jgi:methylmalonyl-CoA mutase N-terminal domain/subunit